MGKAKISSFGGVGKLGVPIEVDNDTEMEENMNKTNVGKCYAYIGTTTEEFVNGRYYILQEEEDS